jgi:hypothetical protein
MTCGTRYAYQKGCRCPQCRQANAAHSRVVRDIRTALGRCVACRNDAQKNRQRCRPCALKHAAHVAAWKARKAAA